MINVFVLVEMHAFLNFIILGREHSPLPGPAPVIFIYEIKIITMHVNAYSECAKMHLSERATLKNTGTY